MTFDDLAQNAGRQARRIGSNAQRPNFVALAARKRRQRTLSLAVASAVGLILLLLAGPLGVGRELAIEGSTTTFPVTTTVLAAECPLTIPTGEFVPPDGLPEDPPDLYSALWHGTAELWTMVPPEGAVWGGLPENTPGVFTQKVFWWTEGLVAMQDPVPPLVVVARNLSSGETVEFSERDITTGFRPDIGSFMISGVGLGVGCWELTGELNGTTTSFVAEIPES